MKNENIEEIRKIFIETLEKYEGEPVLFDIPSEILHELIFEIYAGDARKISKDIKPHLKKIDFSNISFDNVIVYGFDFTGLKNVKINPQTVRFKDLSRTILNGVTFTVHLIVWM